MYSRTQAPSTLLCSPPHTGLSSHPFFSGLQIHVAPSFTPTWARMESREMIPLANLEANPWEGD